MVGPHVHGLGGAHQHTINPSADVRRLAVALGLILAFMAGEVVAGWLSHSLALLSDAAHMLTDAAAVLLAIVAVRLAAAPSEGDFTYGLKRAEILSALANGCTLAVLAVWIVYEAITRLITPVDVRGGPVVIVAVIGIGVNLLASWQLAKANRQSLNIEGSYRHLLTDLYAFIGTALAGGVVLLTGFVRADAIASLLVAALMVRAAYGLIRSAGRALLEAAPEGLDPTEVGKALASHPHVANVHDLHVWEITSGFPALSAHVLVHPGDDCHGIRLELEELLNKRFRLDHTTLQVDHENDPVVHVANSWPGPPRRGRMP
jgi:cobalt-zinc-cadmium efflux system protein